MRHIGSGLSALPGRQAVGDTIVLMGQGYHGTSAAGTIRVRGMVKLARS